MRNIRSGLFSPGLICVLMMSNINTSIWRIVKVDEEQAKKLSIDTKLPLVIARLLINRGIKTIEQAKCFFEPQLENIHDPDMLPDMDVASDRIVNAIKSNEKIMVHGDYDVDGVTSTALMVRALGAMKANVSYRLPHRHTEGYDIKHDTIKKAAESGVKLIITCDCGVSAVETISKSKKYGVDVIITDHHEPGEILPSALAVVNPKRQDSKYPFSQLAGVGVAFKTAQSVVRKLGFNEDSFRDSYLDLVTLGTVSDVVPLLDENRTIVKYGLLSLENSKKKGIQSLISASKIDKSISTYHIGYMLGPRINAVGRMSDAHRAVELLLTKDDNEARKIVEELERYNSQRRIEQARILSEALNILEFKDLSSIRVIVAAGVGWNTGVVGIVAGKIAEMYSRPVIMLCKDDETGMCSGSARSVDGFNLVEGLRKCSDLLAKCGGHALAAGLSLNSSNLELFEKKINIIAEESIFEVVEEKIIDVDAQIEIDDLNWDLANAIAKMEPFGHSNEEPVFATRNLQVVGKQIVGSDHLKLFLSCGKNKTIECIAFGMANISDYIGSDCIIDVCYNFQINSFNGNKSLQMVAKDIKINGN